MRKEMISFEGRAYYLDIDAIAKWCLSSSVNVFKESEINEGYDTNEDGDLQMMTKVVRELKTNNPQDDTIRYDLVKLLISPFLGEIKTFDEVKTSISYTLLFNSLIEMGFLVEIIDE